MTALFVSDLDGTLLTRAGTLSAYSRRELQGLLGAGLPFTVASARSVTTIRSILRGIELALPVVEINGAFISRLDTGRHEVVHHIEPDLLAEIYPLVRECGYSPFVSAFDGEADRLYYKDPVNGGMQWYLDDRLAHRDPRLCRVGDLTRAFKDQVVCLTVIGEAGPLSALVATLKERFGPRLATHYFENAYSPGWHWVTIHDKMATKAEAIRTIMERYGFGGSELVVFGDEENDLAMFELADRAVAVANAATPVKQAATEIIGSNEEDSVVRYLRERWIDERVEAG